jgi:tetratricopeptide (TPR) repeat protein
MKALEVVNQKFRIVNIEGTSLVVYFRKLRDHDEDKFADLNSDQIKIFMREKPQIKNDNSGKESDSVELALKQYPCDLQLANLQAEQMIKKGNINQGKRILLEIINKSPENVSELINLAAIEYTEKEYPSAKEFIKDALILDPSNENAKSLLRDIENQINVCPPADHEKPVINSMDFKPGKDYKNNQKYIYFGHHKCATTWISSIIESVSQNAGLCSAKIHNLEMIQKDKLKNIQFLSDTNSASIGSELLNGFNYAGFHVIRDPRDIIVSAYFSHKKTHASGEWLIEHRKKLKSVDLDQGLRLEMDFRSDELKALRNWNYKNPKVYETRFEIITVNALNEFRKIFKFLGIFPEFLSNHLLENIIQAHSFDRLSKGRKPGEEDSGSHYRKGIHGDWVNYISGKNKDYFKGKYGQLLIDLGYEDDFDW